MDLLHFIHVVKDTQNLVINVKQYGFIEINVVINVQLNAKPSNYVFSNQAHVELCRVLLSTTQVHETQHR